jgi:hypothetical protein
MSTCEKCGKTYYTRVCLNCKDKAKPIYGNPKLYKESLKNKKNSNTYNQEPKTEKEKLFKTIRYAIIFFMGLFVIGAIVDVVVVNYIFKSTAPVINDMNEMTRDMMKANKKLMKQMEQGFKIPTQNK